MCTEQENDDDDEENVKKRKTKENKTLPKEYWEYTEVIVTLTIYLFWGRERMLWQCVKYAHCFQTGWRIFSTNEGRTVRNGKIIPTTPTTITPSMF